MTNRTPDELRPPARRHPRRRRLGLPVVLLATLLLAGCAHTLGTADGTVPRFDLRRPGCEPRDTRPEPADPDAVLVRYLGAGGLYLEWREQAVMFGPFFSNPGPLRVGFGRIRPDPEAIDDGLAGLPLKRVGAVLFGHSHYDHLGDLPWMADRLARAQVYANRTGCDALKPYADAGGPLRGRLTALEEIAGRSVRLHDRNGRPLPFRLHAVPADHAPHLGPISLMTGEGRVLDRPWEELRYWKLREGQAFAFVVELTDGTDDASPVRFRLLYQDAAGTAVLDALPASEAAPYDLAVSCIASAHLVDGYPRRVLARAAPRHTLAVHYDHFLKPRRHRRSFVPLLTRRRANRFLLQARAGMGDGGSTPVPPDPGVCGAATDAWTLPLVDEWMVFRPLVATPDER